MIGSELSREPWKWKAIEQRDSALREDHSVVQAPSKPVTPFGEMLAYYLEMEPELFESAVEDQFKRIKQQRDEAIEASETESESEGTPVGASQSTDITLSGLSERIQAVEERERQATVEDLMYMCILEEFIKLNIGMLPKMDNYTDIDSISLSPLMEGVHTREALDLVRPRPASAVCHTAAVGRSPLPGHACPTAAYALEPTQVKEHMMGLLGQTAMMPPTATLKMSRLQMLQVYGASVMFGYFLRRADKRFQLSRSMGMLAEDKDDAVARLERLFSLVRPATLFMAVFAALGARYRTTAWCKPLATRAGGRF